MKLVRGHTFRDERGKLVKILNQNSNAPSASKFITHDAYVAISESDVFRGMHRQAKPNGQSKLVTIISGSIIFFALDMHYAKTPILQVARLDASNEEFPNSVITDHESFTGYYTETSGTIVAALSDAPYLPDFEEVINPSLLILKFAGAKIASKIMISKKDMAGNDPPSTDSIDIQLINI